MLRILFTAALLLIASLPSADAAEKQTSSSKFEVELQALAMKYFNSTQNELMAMHLYSQTRDVIKVTDGDLKHGINRIGTIEDRMAVFPGKVFPRELAATEVIPLGMDYAVTITSFTAKLIDFAGNQKQQNQHLQPREWQLLCRWRFCHVAKRKHGRERQCQAVRDREFQHEVAKQLLHQNLSGIHSDALRRVRHGAGRQRVADPGEHDW